MTPQERYVAASHAMQSGVAMDMTTDPNQKSQGATTPKHLRVGINSAMVDASALAELLMAKGIITQAEYLEAIAAGMEREQARYEQILSRRTGSKITLA